MKRKRQIINGDEGCCVGLPLSSANHGARLLTVFLAVGLMGAGCAAQAPQGSPSAVAERTGAVPPAMPGDEASTSSQIALNNSLAAAALQLAVPESDYRLGPEDLLEITLFNVPESEVGVTPRKMEARVSQQGIITLPLLGDLTVAGQTTADVEQTLATRYAKYLRRPEVGVVVKDYRSQRVSVIGAVGTPGVFQLTGPKTLIDLLAMAGGVSDNAGRQVHLYRQGENGRESQVLDLYTLVRNPDSLQAAEVANLMVQAGDVINVPEAGMFFIDGAVKQPGSFPMNRPYTLTQALSRAGVDEELAKMSNITIVRRQGGTEVATISADLNQIRTGTAADPMIEAEDVIIVPTSGVKFFVKRFVSGFSIGSFIRPF